MMETVFFILFFAAVITISLFVSYLLLVYIYGDKDPRKWKFILFTEKDTDRTMLFPNQGKGKPNNEPMVDAEVEARKKKNKFSLRRYLSLCYRWLYEKVI